MKSFTIPLAAAALIQLSAASPLPGGAHTQVEWVTIQAPDVVVYADEFGRPTATATAAAEVVVETAVTVTVDTFPTPPPAVVVNNKFAAPEAAPAPTRPASPPPPPPPPPPHGAVHPVEASNRAADPAVQKSTGYGISWTPFNGEEGATSCKSQAQTDEEYGIISSQGFTKVRTYGVGCDQVALSLRAAAKYGMGNMLGIWDIDTADGEAANLVSQVRATGLGWGSIEAIVVGNEDLERGRGVADVKHAIRVARDVLRQAGYDGPVVHVDTAGAILRHPSMCGADGGDFVAANVHPFFNPAVMPSAAGLFVQGQVGLLRACSALHSRKRATHRVVVTETGWPNAGGSNGLAVPGRDQQATAVESIKHHLANDVYLYSAFDNRWLKDNAGTFGVEKHWGMF